MINKVVRWLAFIDCGKNSLKIDYSKAFGIGAPTLGLWAGEGKEKGTF